MGARRPAAGDVWLLIPAYNEGPVISSVLEAVRHAGYQVVVVDDCSTDTTHAEVARHEWVHLLRHPINLGQGAALQTAAEYALAQGAQFLVHFDSDGQHPIEEVPLLLRTLIRSRSDVVLGTRFPKGRMTAGGMPPIKRLVLRLATLYTRLTTGLAVTDTHNGFRAMTADAARRIVITQNRMAHASEILHLIARHRLRYREVPVTIRYTEYSMAKGQSVWNAVNILWEDLLYRRG